MVQGDAYPEVTEQRLRTRMAVLQALGIRGYKPVDTVHIGYFSINWPSTRLAKIPDGGIEEEDKPNRPHIPLMVPYEWCESGGIPMAGSAVKMPIYSRVLVLWVDENVFYDLPFSRLGFMLRKLITDKQQRNLAHVSIIGPHISTTLKAMVDEAAQLPENARVAHLPFEGFDSVDLISPWATACEAALTHGLKKNSAGKIPSISELISRVNGLTSGPLHFVRSTLTDDKTCNELAEELKRRNIDWSPRESRSHAAETNSREEDAALGVDKAKPTTQPTDAIALVGEWDTVYGRALPLTFISQAARIDFRDLAEHPDKCPANIRPFVYLRGIDGKVAPGESMGDVDTSKPGDSKSDSPHGNLPINTPSEQPEGNNQSDGLRRLAEQLAAWNRDLKQHGRRLAAVGILGTDLYDKLLAMQALRDRLPSGVIFFTTDLDARYNLPSEWNTAHNLIVCSSYGLQLDRYFQGSIPPFRDSLQTATFAAAVSAVDPVSIEPGKWPQLLNVPRVFEIGRTGAFDMSVDLSAYSRRGETDGPAYTGAPPKSIQPARTDLQPWLGDSIKKHYASALWMSVLLVALAFTLGARPTFSSTNLQFGSNPIRYSLVWLGRAIDAALTRTPFFLALAVPATLLLLGHFIRHQEVDAEPLTLFEGVGIWPTEAIRIISAALCLHFIFKTYREAEQSNRDLEADYRLPKYCPAQFIMREQFTTIRGQLKSFLRDMRCVVFSYSGWRVYGSDHDPCRHSSIESASQNSADVKIYAEDLWAEYTRHASYFLRFLRVVLATVLFYFAEWSLMEMLGHPASPVRGESALALDKLVNKTSVILATFFTFFVLDATYLNAMFIRYLLDAASHWPHGADEEYKGTHLAPKDLIEYLDIQVIARRTEVVGKIIYFPFVIYFLMIISRISLFDNWAWPADLLFVMCISVALAILTAMLLRSRAEEARQIAISKINMRRVASLAVGDEQKAEAFQLLIDDVKAERGGAFSVLSQYPWVAAILLPSSGIGVWVFLQHFTQLSAGQ